MNAMVTLPETDEVLANNGTTLAIDTKRTKMLLGSYTVKQINAQGQVETVTYNIPDEIY